MAVGARSPDVDRGAPRRRLPAWAFPFGWASGYFVTYVTLDRLADVYATTPQISLWHPSAALTLALLWVRGLGYLPVAVVAAVAANWLRLDETFSFARSLPSALGTTLAYAAAAILLRRFTGIRPSLGRTRDFAWFVLLGIGLAPALSGVLGVTGLRLASFVSAAQYRTALRSSWVGDLAGLATLGPLTVWLAVHLSRTALAPRSRHPAALAIAAAEAGSPQSRWHVDQPVELAAQTVAVGLSCWLSFGAPGGLSHPGSGVHLSFLYFGALAWVALRRGATAIAVTVAAASTAAVLIARPALKTLDASTDVQVFLSATAVIICFLGAAVSSRQDAERRLSHAALHDVLTGLPNRLLFTDRLTHALIRSEDAASGGTAVLVLDIDRFALVNDSLGHDAGDRLLRAVAWRLATSLRPADTVARLGGDEFGILMEDVRNLGQATATAQRLLEALAPPVTVGAHQLFVTASIGVVLGENRSGEYRELLDEAILAQHRAKRTGRGGFAVYDSQLADAAQRRLGLETELRAALADGGLRLCYQPIVHTDGSGVLGVEALIRWDGLSGPLPAEELIAVAEEAGMMVTLGRWALEESCRQLATWLAYGGVPATLRVSVNISARHLAHPSFVREVRDILERTRLPATHLTVEITESVLVEDSTHAVLVLYALRELGIRVHIDDFGTGYSSLSYLTRLPLDALKIDRSFVSRLGQEREADVVVAAVIGMARALGLHVVAEGVETTTQAEFLGDLGCGALQGYLISRPLPPADVPAALASLDSTGIAYGATKIVTDLG